MNDNQDPEVITKAGWQDWAAYIFIAAMAAAVPGGLLAAWYFDIPALAVISVVAFIFFMAG